MKQTALQVPAAGPTQPGGPPPDRRDAPVEDPGLLQVFTLVIWVVWLAIGLAGLLTSPPVPPPPPKPPAPPTEAELIKVDLLDEPAPPTAVPPAGLQPATPDQSVPPLPAVALPSPAIAFALPTEGPVRIVSAAQASGTRIPPSTAVQRLTYGQGQGKQPAPEYPVEAQLEREEGLVGVRLAVGEDGSVTSATVFAPSRWPLLNQSAVRAVRERWRFPSGPRRLYEVFIRFHLNEM